MSEVLRAVLGFAVLFALFGVYGLVSRKLTGCSGSCGSCASSGACGDEWKVQERKERELVQISVGHK